MRLRRLKTFTAPYRYIFKDPDTGRQFEAESKIDLIKLIVSYRAQNELPIIEGLDIVVDNYLASQPENISNSELGPELSRGWVCYLKGGIALLENLYYGEKNMVNQQEADRRASICTGCPHNVFPDKGFFLRWADDIARASVGERKAVQEQALGNCNVCTCTLRAKVWYKGPFFATKKELAEFPDFCWQKAIAKDKDLNKK